MSLIDLAFLLVETDDSPKHVAGLQIFRKPKGSDRGFVDQLQRHWLAGPVSPPFNQIPTFTLGKFAHWADYPDFCLANQLYHHRLPAPGKKAQLIALVERLHSSRLLAGRPLWECHLVDGLAGGRFAVFFKIHHAYGDGHRISRWLSRPLSPHVKQLPSRAYWQDGSRTSGPGGQGRPVTTHIMASLREQTAAVPGMCAMGLRQGLKWLGIGRNGVVPPFSAPRTLLNDRLGPARQVALLRFPVARLRRLGSPFGCTINDVFVTLCDRALAAYLAGHGGLPDQPLVAQVPVSLRAGPDTGLAGNRVTLALVRLASHDEDPIRQMLAIHQACEDAKREAHGISQTAMNGYTSVLAAGVLLAEAVGLGPSLPPLGNVLISNLPGDPRRLYLGPAALLEAYPVSTLMPSLALNITVYSYAGGLFVGMACDRKILRDLPRLASLMRKAWRDMETAAETAALLV